jgi:hypothetical protein
MPMLERSLIKAVGLAVIFGLGLTLPAQAAAIMLVTYKRGEFEFRSVPFRVPGQPMTMFDCREVLSEAIPVLRRKLENAEDYPELVGWRYSTTTCELEN